LAIPNAIPNSVEHARSTAPRRLLAALLFLLIPGLAVIAPAADWSIAEQQLARKIVAVTGTNPVLLTFENRSSVGRRESEIIQNGVRSVLEALGVRFAKTEQAAAEIKVSLSENVTSYVWVAQIRRGEGEPVVVLASLPRPAGTGAAHDSLPLSLRKIPLWTQADPILDVAVLEENAAPTRMAVLSPENISLYRLQGGKWQAEASLEIAHAKPWPRDLRGKLIVLKDHSLDVYLPGVFCHSATASSLNCRSSSDPWPLFAPGLTGGEPSPSREAASSSSTITPTNASFDGTRNFFTGALTPPLGKVTTVGQFYSAAAVMREKSALWLFAGTDGQVHLVDGTGDQAVRLDWGSDLTSVKTACGAGWQVLATNSDAVTGDSVRAYEFPDRDPVAVSGAVEFPGAISALWTEAKGDTAVAIAKNQVTGSYEAFRLAMACNQ